MGWAALGKVAMGAVKGKAKQIATDKLLNRKKKPQSVQSKRDGGGVEGKGGDIIVRPSTSMVHSPGGAIVQAGPSMGGGGGALVGQTLEESAESIRQSVVDIDNFLKGTLAAEKAQQARRLKESEKVERSKEEAELEKDSKKKGKGIKIGAPKQVKSFWESLKNFFMTIVVGWIAVRLVDFLPHLKKITPIIFGFGEWLINLAGIGFNILVTAIDWGYKLVEMGRSWIKGLFGEEGAQKFDIFMGNIRNLINGFIAWKLIGEKIFKAVINSIKNAFRFVRKIWVKIKRLIGRKARIFFKKVLERVAAAARSGLQWAGNVAQKGLSKLGGLFGKGAGKLASTGAGKAVAKVGGWATKIFGKAAKFVAPALKAATPAVKGFAGRIPVLGPIIVAIVSLMSGEPVGQALFKGVGAALGGALGTFIPIPVLGTLIGETIGVFVGDLLYELIMGGGMGAVGQKLKDTFTSMLKGGKAVFNWLKDGFVRLIDGLPKNPFRLGTFLVNPFNIVDKVKLLAKAFFSRETMAAPKSAKDIEAEEKRKEMMEGVKKKIGQVKDFAGNVLGKVDPRNWFKGATPYEFAEKKGLRINNIEDGTYRYVTVSNPRIFDKEGNEKRISLGGTYKQSNEVSTEEFINKHPGFAKKHLKNLLKDRRDPLGIKRAAGGIADAATGNRFDFDKRNRQMEHEYNTYHEGGKVPGSGERMASLLGGEIVIDNDSSVAKVTPMLLAINAAKDEKGVMKAISDYAPYEGISGVQTVMVPMAKSIGSEQEVIKEVEQSAAPVISIIGGRRASAALYRGDG